MRSALWGRVKGTAAHGALAIQEQSASTGTLRLLEEESSQLKKGTPAVLDWAITTSAGICDKCNLFSPGESVGINCKYSLCPCKGGGGDLIVRN